MHTSGTMAFKASYEIYVGTGRHVEIANSSVMCGKHTERSWKPRACVDTVCAEHPLIGHRGSASDPSSVQCVGGCSPLSNWINPAGFKTSFLPSSLLPSLPSFFFFLLFYFLKNFFKTFSENQILFTLLSFPTLSCYTNPDEMFILVPLIVFRSGFSP